MLFYTRIQKFLLYSLCGWLLILPLAAANGTDKPTCPAQPIKIGFTELVPYYENGSGIAVDLWKELKKRSGCAFEPIERPRARLWAELKEGLVAMSGAGVATPEREVFTYFANYVRLKTMAVFKAANASKLKNMEDLVRNDSLNIGIIRGIKYGGSIDLVLERIQKKNRKRINDVTTPEQLFKLFQLDRVQVIFAESITYSKYFKSLGVTDIRTLDPTASDPILAVSLVMSKTMFSKAEAAKWRALVDSIRADGTMKTILLKYVSPSEADLLLKF